MELQIDAGLEKRAREICKRWGFSLEEYLEDRLREFINDPFYSESNHKALLKSMAQAERGEVMRFKSIEELENLTLEDIENKCKK